jgi:hypothetical protein
MEEKKASLVASLLTDSTSVSTNSTGNRILIQEVNPDPNPDLDLKAPREDETKNKIEEPSLMDLMLAAQQEAKQASDAIKTVERVKESKKFGGGFKKGFLSGSSSGSGSSSSKISKTTKPNHEEKKDSQPQNAIPTIKGQPQQQQQQQAGLVLDDVQEAMKEESNPLLQQIKQGEWATPELMDSLRQNPILANGLQNPKCLSALQLLQKDPKEAKKRFENDSEVSFFLQEFGKVMSSHFNELGNQQQQQQQQSQSQQQQRSVPSSTSSSGSKIQEIGPLHAEAIARQKQSSLQGNENTVIPLAGSQDDSDDNVKQVRSLLCLSLSLSLSLSVSLSVSLSLCLSLCVSVSPSLLPLPLS